MTVAFWTAPRPGDIVQCRFPESIPGNPGPKERPALVTQVATHPNGAVDVAVAYGTSQGISEVHPGELVVPRSQVAAGLTKDTKFDLRNIVRLPFNNEWFAPDPARRYGEHPKRGKFDTTNVENKRKLQAAVMEAGITASDSSKTGPKR